MKLYRLCLAQAAETIGPVFHGTPYAFELESLRGNRDDTKFFSSSYAFASDYAHQKSQEGKMDADIKVLKAYIQGKVFNAQNQQHIEAILPFLPEKVVVYNDFGMDAGLPVEKWKDLVSGVYVAQPEFSEQDLAGKKVGDWLPDNECYDRPHKYELIKLTPDMVYYARIGTIDEVRGGRYNFRWETDLPKDFTVEEVANDLINLDRIAFMRKYRDTQRKFDYHVYKASRQPKTTYNNDTWRWLEGDGVFEAAKKAGFDIVMGREKGTITYAVFPTAKILPVEK